jgi:uncharacterized protein YkwD
MFMRLRILPVILLVFILFFSCKKTDVVVDNSNANNNNNNSGTVYNVNKATLLQLVNDIRKKGCNCGSTVMPPVSAVVWNDQLAKAAYDHSVDMNTHDYFSHTGLDGLSPAQRITAAGYLWS